jgi:hypothetical protein
MIAMNMRELQEARRSGRANAKPDVFHSLFLIIDHRKRHFAQLQVKSNFVTRQHSMAIRVGFRGTPLYPTHKL